MAVPLGVLSLNDGPVSASFSFPPVWQPGGVGDGGPVTVRENVPVAVAPARISHCERLHPGRGWRTEQEPSGPQRQRGRRLPGPVVWGCAAGRLEARGEEGADEHVAARTDVTDAATAGEELRVDRQRRRRAGAGPSQRGRLRAAGGVVGD